MIMVRLCLKFEGNIQLEIKIYNISFCMHVQHIINLATPYYKIFELKHSCQWNPLDSSACIHSWKTGGHVGIQRYCYTPTKAVCSAIWITHSFMIIVCRLLQLYFKTWEKRYVQISKDWSSYFIFYSEEYTSTIVGRRWLLSINRSLCWHVVHIACVDFFYRH